MNRFVESDVRWVFTVELPDEDEGFFLGAENIPRCMHYVIGILIANENKGGVKNSLFAVEKLSLWEAQLSSLKPKTLSMGGGGGGGGRD